MSKTIKKVYVPKPGTAAHKLLALLYSGQREERELFGKTRTAGQSTNLWREKVLTPLWGGGWIELNNNRYGLTPVGLTKLRALEEVKPQLERTSPQVATKPQRYLAAEEGPWTGVSMSPIRPGAMDFLDCPSRVGSQLFYRKEAKNAE